MARQQPAPRPSSEDRQKSIMEAMDDLTLIIETVKGYEAKILAAGFPAEFAQQAAQHMLMSIQAAMAAGWMANAAR